MASLENLPELMGEITNIVFGELPPDPQPCDVIFIFGGSHPELWETAAKAYFNGLGREIIATGGFKPGARRHPAWRDGDTSEAQVMRRELVRLGVPAEIIFLEDRSTNSLENVLFAKEVYDFSKVKSILVVTKSYAIGRQVRTLRHHIDPAILTIPYPFEAHIAGSGPLITRTNWVETEESIHYVLMQLMKIWKYGAAGDIQPIADPSAQLVELIQAQLA
jgi:uncharacterized SAM-binding protein YcdF (DUF218 family)